MDETPRLGSLLALLAGFLALGGPLVLYVWHELSELLMGRIRPAPLGLAALLLGVLLWWAARLGRRLQRHAADAGAHPRLDPSTCGR